MTPWKDYLKDVRVMVPQCPDVVIIDAIRDAAQEFCEASLCWQDSVMPFPIDPNRRDIDIEGLADGAIIIQPMWVGNDTPLELEAKSEEWLDANTPGWRYTTADQPRFYTVPVRGKVMWLAPHPSATITLDMRVALKPSDESVDGPDDLFQDYRLPIQAGAIAILASIPRKPWTDPRIVMQNGAIFESWKGKALTRVSRGNTRARMRAKLDHRF